MSFDNDITSHERLAAAGIVDAPQAAANVAMLRKTLGPEAETFLPVLFAQLATAADPDMALNATERFIGSFDDPAVFLSLIGSRPDFLTNLVTVFGASRFLSTFLLQDPARSLHLLADNELLGPSPGREQPAARLAALTAPDEAAFFRSLRLFRKREMLRIALRDLLNRADLRETVEDLSDLAEVCLEAAYEWAGRALSARHGRPVTVSDGEGTVPARFAVIAMGKLGGRELNFSSDIDLMYVYSADGETEGVPGQDGARTNRITNHQYFIKLAEKLTAAIGQKTEDGFVFRVDLRLRPEGQRGALAQSLGGYEIYYESWGQTWERSALIKARPVAGDEALGREFTERVTPFVFRKYLDYGAIAEIGEMKQKINKDVELKGRTHRDVKLGYGGIREIEFIAQALQLIYAGRDRALRERTCLRALHLLTQKGLLTHREHEVLSRAYVFLRMVEHRIQLLDDLQTQTMPAESRELRALARRCGYRNGGEADQLLQDYTAHTEAVRKVYDDLFAFTGEARDGGQQPGEFDLLLAPETPEQEASELFLRCGFRDPEKAYRNLILLREGSAFLHLTPRSRTLFNDMFPALFKLIVASPDPDMALNHLESFLSAQGSWESFQSLLGVDASAGKVLIAVFGNSDYLSRMLISQPVLLQNLLESRSPFGAGTARVYARGLAEALDRAPGITEKLDALRRFKHEEEVRIGMADLLANLVLRTVSRDLSKLAEVCLDGALALAATEVGRRYRHAPSCQGLAIIGAGKLGGRELDYGSDLDILFVYAGETPGSGISQLSAFEFFSKVAEKTISYLSTLTREGFAFRVDTRLRPTGSKGPLVQSVDAFRAYFSGQAETWERQAMVRARAVAGDRELGRMFCIAMNELIYRVPGREPLARDIRNMRARMEEELGRAEAGSYNIKQGAGGLVDIEFLVQYLQLLHGKAHRRVRVPGTRNALHALRREGLVARDVFEFLDEAYGFLRRLESRMRIVTNQASSRLARDPAQVQPLARRMGYSDPALAGQQLLRDYEAVTTRVRRMFTDLLSETAAGS